MGVGKVFDYEHLCNSQGGQVLSEQPQLSPVGGPLGCGAVVAIKTGPMHTRVDFPDHLGALAASQAWVVTSDQLSELSLGTLRRLRKDWRHLSRGVWCLREPTWESVAWAGLLRGGESAVLGGAAAAHTDGLLPRAPATICVWVPPHASVSGMEWGPWVVKFRRGERRAWGHPPRTRPEDTVLDSTRELDADSVIALAARALTERRTTRERVLEALSRRQRVSHRSSLEELCSVAGEGIESVLEWRYLERVERRHRLPTLARQARLDGVARLDGLYREFGLAVELDGRAFHDVTADMGRDNRHALTHGITTLRYGWQAVTTQPCVVAAEVARALNIRGWTGRSRRCRDCPVP